MGNLLYFFIGVNNCNNPPLFLSKLINKVYHELEIALQKENRYYQT